MLRTYFQETFYDMQVDVAQKYAMAIREAILTGKDFDAEKKKGFYLSAKGTSTIRGNFEDKLYVGNIKRIENHLYWNDEELQDDDQIVNVIVMDGPVTRDGDGCSYGSKDHRDQILYANTIPQVVGHVFIINTPGGASSSRIDYEQAIADCREKGKPTVAWIDGLCCSAGQLVAALCDRTIVMNGRHTMGCIGTMCAFWGVANGTVDQDGFRYIDLVSVTSPDKNAEYREAVDGKTEKLQAELDKLGEEFRETVRQNRPLVKEEHLTGKTFDAQNVMGALVDEIGDYSRAIQAVFDLAGETLTAARFMTPEEDVNPEENPDGEEQKDMAQLNEQQKAAIAKSGGSLMMVDGGHVTTDVQGFFGPETVEVAKPQNQEDMPDEEKKAQEAQGAPATQEQAPGTESAAEEKKAQEAQGAPATQEQAPGTESAAEEEKPAGEAPAQEEEKPAGEAPASEGEEEKPAGDAPAEEEKPAEEDRHSEDALENAQKEIDKMQETLKNAEMLVEQKDKEIEEKNKEIASYQKVIDEKVKESTDALQQKADEVRDLTAKLTEKDTLIADLQKQVADLQAENKELSGMPAHMVDDKGASPAGNGTGAAPKVNKHQRIKRGMSYAQIQAIMAEE